jgi:hypothetical protein
MCEAPLPEDPNIDDLIASVFAYHQAPEDSILESRQLQEELASFEAFIVLSDKLGFTISDAVRLCAPDISNMCAFEPSMPLGKSEESILFSLRKLTIAKKFLNTDDAAFAIDSRNEAVAQILRIEGLDETQKQVFIEVVNQFFGDVIKPFVLTDTFLQEQQRREQAIDNNSNIKVAMRAMVREQLSRRYGDSDYMKQLAIGITSFSILKLDDFILLLSTEPPSGIADDQSTSKQLDSEVPSYKTDETYQYIQGLWLNVLSFGAKIDHTATQALVDNLDDLIIDTQLRLLAMGYDPSVDLPIL